jgi:hypothetical protein
MKNTHSIFTTFLVFIFLTSFTGLAFADWKLDLVATGKKIKGQYKSTVTIGAAQKSSHIPAPPTAPVYSCRMVIYDTSDWSATLNTDLHDIAQPTQMWVISVNPHGNTGPPADQSVTVSWNPDRLGPGNFEIREGWDGTGAVVVNMKEKSSMTVTGGNEDIYFSIVQP